METGVRLIVQHYEVATGNTLEESILHEDRLSKAKTLKEFGYLHVEQIDFLQKIQDFKTTRQILLNNLSICPVCKSKTKKSGTFKSKFHAVLTDHEIIVQRTSCKCGWSSASSIDGIYGSSMHPDLLKKQALHGGKESYEKSSKSLNSESACTRAINSHSQIYKSVKKVGETLESIKISTDYGKSPNVADNLIVNIDGGHIKSRGDSRSFEAMIATVHNPNSLKYVNQTHNTITFKTIVSSAKDDKQETMKALFKNSCKRQGMTSKTNVTCLADGAENCWSIADSIKDSCQNSLFILDWFHIAMKFKNISIPTEHVELYDKIKWHLWHGNPVTSLARLKSLTILIEDSTTKIKLKKLSTYIQNNKKWIVNYADRKKEGLTYTSNLAETTVNTLINDRQKGKKKMLWSREGAHNVLQIRASQFSNSWDDDWAKLESKIYLKAA